MLDRDESTNGFRWLLQRPFSLVALWFGVTPRIQPEQLRVLARNPEEVQESWSARRINKLQTGMADACTYLEVGVQHGLTLEGVKIRHRVGVDPIPRFDLESLPQGTEIFVGTSDEYFASIDEEVLFDVIFLDGLHEWFQTYKDIVNSLNHLTTGGVIVVDDVVPCDEISAIPSLEESYRIRVETGSPERRWHGDVFKALFALQELHDDSVRFRVILDVQGNSQAIVWHRVQVPVKPVILAAQPEMFSELTFDTAFAGGVPPEFFGCGPEDEVLAEAASAVANQRQRPE